MSSSSSISPTSPLPFPLTSTSHSPTFAQRFLFTFVNPLLTSAYSRPIAVSSCAASPRSDLFSLPYYLESARYTKQLQEAYSYEEKRQWERERESERERRRRSGSGRKKERQLERILMRAIWRAFKKDWFIHMGFLRLLTTFLRLLRPFVLQNFLHFLSTITTQTEQDLNSITNSSPTSSISHSALATALFYALGLTLLNVIVGLLENQFWFRAVQLALTIRGSCIGILHAKSLRLHHSTHSHSAQSQPSPSSPSSSSSSSSSPPHNWTSARLNNLATVDVDALMNFYWSSAFDIFSLPLVVSLTILYLIYLLSFSALLGLSLLLLTFFFSALIASHTTLLLDRMYTFADKRVEELGEILKWLKVIKLSAYEKIWWKRVSETREKQQKYLLQSSLLDALNRFLGLSSPFLVCFFTFFSHVFVFHRSLDPTLVFTSLLLFHQLRDPLCKVPEVVKEWISARLAEKRIDELMREREKEEYVKVMRGEKKWKERKKKKKEEEKEEEAEKEEREVVLRIENANFAWGEGVEVKEEEEERRGEGEGIELKARMGEGKENELDDDPFSPSSTTSLIPSSSTPIASLNGVFLHSIPPSPSSSSSLSFSSPSSSSSSSPPRLALNNINVSIYSGELIMIVGSVGSSKSALLLAILSELHLLSGSITLFSSSSSSTSSSSSSPSIAYTHQTTWLESSTIRSNILFGLPYDPSWYQTVLESCALLPDLQRLEKGDLTILGENGTDLSGGQKMRLSLARAVYSRASLYLLDDPIAAVDARVSRWLWEKCLSNGEEAILRGKTRVIVTHQLQYGPMCDRIIVMERSEEGEEGEEEKGGGGRRGGGGRIKCVGTYEELVKQGMDFKTIVGEMEKSTHEANERAKQRENAKELIEEIAPSIPLSPIHPSSSTTILPTSSQPSLIESEAEFTIDDLIIDSSPPPNDSQDSSSFSESSKLIEGNKLKHSHSIGFALSSSAFSSSYLQPTSPSVSSSSSSSTNLYPTLSPSIPSSIPSSSYLHATVAAEHTTATAEAAGGIREEEVHLGAVKGDVYQQYFEAGGGKMGYVAVLVMVIASQGFAIGGDYSLALWSSANTASSSSLSPSDSSSSSSSSSSSAGSIFLYSYGLLTILSSLFFLFRSLSISILTSRSANSFHHRFFSRLLGAPQYWFDSIPSGRIMNRLGKDQSAMDLLLPNVCHDLVTCGGSVAGSILTVVIVRPLAIIPLIGIAGLYYYYQLYYRNAAVQLKRREAVSRSPIFQHFNDTTLGLLTLRAFVTTNHTMERTVEHCYYLIDTNTRIYFHSFCVHRWLSVRLEMIGCAVVFISACFSLLLLNQLSSGEGGGNGGGGGGGAVAGVGLVGLCVTSTLTMAGELNWLVRQLTEMEVQMNAVERVLEYTNVEQEEKMSEEEIRRCMQNQEGEREEEEEEEGQISRGGGWKSRKQSGNEYMPVSGVDNSNSSSNHDMIVDVDTDSSLVIPPANWLLLPPSSSSSSFSSPTSPSSSSSPPSGSILIRHLSMSYLPDPSSPLVLRHINASILPGEKVGIVGRTAAGKSTIAVSLFRLMEAREGEILIDGVLISKIPLSLLRSRLSIIPQEPCLFSASIRFNLDPEGKKRDVELWKMLKRIDMCGRITALEGELDYVVAEGGNDFSVGEKQLLCLARAALRGSRIVVCDEMSSALDYATDIKIKEFIRSEFEKCTVLTIAHRLSTVLDSDRIMVMEKGELKEFDTPQKLMEMEDGLLRQLVRDASTQSGHAMA